MTAAMTLLIMYMYILG